MAIKTGREFVDSLRKLKSVLYLNGEKVENFVDHPIVKPSINTLAMVYDMACDPRYEDVMTAVSPLINDKVSIKVHIPQSKDDLIKRVLAVRLLQQKSGGVCTMRNVDPLVPAYSVTYEIDQKHGTEYHERYKEFLRRVQREDLNLNFSITDPKGDRTLRPHQQADPDLYLRVVDKNKDGIVVRGAKLHQTGAIACHEKLIFPTRTMTKNDKDYVVAFSIPSDAEGITHVYGRYPNDMRWHEEGEIDKGNARYTSHSTLVFYDDVFVPWDRVYMFGEYEFTGLLLKRFGDHHRTTYGGCRAGWCDVITGMAASIAEYNGVHKNATIRDKIVEMVYLGEAMYATGFSAAVNGYETPSGAYHPDALLANVCKVSISTLTYEIARIAEDIAGGLLLTMPSEKDIKHPDLKERFEKYFKGVPHIPAEQRIRMFTCLSSMIFGSHAIDLHVSCPGAAGGYHGARMMIEREINLDEKKRLARIAAGIEESD